MPGAKEKRLGRPQVAVDGARIGRLRAQGRTIREIADELECSSGLVHRTLANEHQATGGLGDT